MATRKATGEEEKELQKLLDENWDEEEGWAGAVEKIKEWEMIIDSRGDETKDLYEMMINEETWAIACDENGETVWAKKVG